MNYHLPKNQGFTITELLISIAIITLLTITVTTFQRDVFYLSNTAQSSLNAQFESRHVVKVMVAELRKASPSSLGAYPLSLASTSAITFYTDVDSNGVKDRVRYFLSGKSLKKGVLAPSGNPLAYVDSNETVSTLVSDVVASSTQPLFQYYGSSYDGASSALSQPVTVSLVRLVKITVIIDRDPGHSPSQIIATSQVSLRNVKDNL